MVSKTVEAVLAAEADADRIYAEGVSKADEIVKSAEDNCLELKRIAEKEAKGEADAIILDAQKKSDAIRDRGINEAEKLVCEITSEASKNFDAAVAAVIELIS